MKRYLPGLSVLTLTVALVACAGDTESGDQRHEPKRPAERAWADDRPAGNLVVGIRDQPGEASHASDAEVCGVGTGPKEADLRCGPASWENPDDINLNVVVGGVGRPTRPTTTAPAVRGPESWSQGGVRIRQELHHPGRHKLRLRAQMGYKPGTGNGQFTNPLDLATDAAGNVYVADTINDRIQKFTSSGAFILKWGGPGTGNGQFEEPAGVATDPAGNVYVAERNHRLQKFDSSGTFLTKWGTLGSGDGQVNAPEDIATDSAGQRLRGRHRQPPDPEVQLVGSLHREVGHSGRGQRAVLVS